MKKNIITKTMLFTLGFVIALAIVFFAFMSLAFPGVVAGWCEKTGNYSWAVKFASLHYKYTGDVEEAARCAQDSIFTGNSEYIIEYGTQFIDHKDFDSYCAGQDEYYSQKYSVEYSYRQYIYGEIAVAYYSRGNTQTAIGCAIQALDTGYDRYQYSYDAQATYSITGFAYGNALMSLSYEIIDKTDGGAAIYVLEVLENVTCDGAEQEYLTLFTNLLTKVAQGTYLG